MMKLPRNKPITDTFATDEERQRAIREREVDEFVKILPESMAKHILCGGESAAEMPSAEVRSTMLEAVLKSCAGPKGDVLREARKTIQLL
eukprot:2314579-Pleurochrysis_carterae.AAC.1